MRGSSQQPTAVTVVTVDDQQVFLSAAREVIEATPGFTSVAEVSSGEEALRAVDDHGPELVLLDVRMPGMNGIETARRIKEGHPDVVVVLISIEEPASLPAAAGASGAAAMVRKQDFGSGMLRGLWSAHGSAS